jgi:hypothetical protein
MELETEVPVEPAGGVLLDDKEAFTPGAGPHRPERLGGPGRVALLAISVEPIQT